MCGGCIREACNSSKKKKLQKAVMKVTGECTDRSFGTVCLPGPCRSILEVIKQEALGCSNSLDDDIDRVISKDWFDIEEKVCLAPPGKYNTVDTTSD